MNYLISHWVIYHKNILLQIFLNKSNQILKLMESYANF